MDFEDSCVSRFFLPVPAAAFILASTFCDKNTICQHNLQVQDGTKSIPVNRKLIQPHLVTPKLNCNRH